MATTTPSRPSATGRGRLPAPVRDRRPALAALALLLVLGGALASALVAYRSGDRVDVLVAARDIGVGERVDADDFRVARVAADGADVVPSSVLDSYVGTRATGAVPEGALITNRMFIASGVVPDDGAVVGATLSSSQRPAVPLDRGDVVQVYSVSSDGATATLLVQAARVVDVSSDGGDSLVASLLVPESDLAQVVSATTTGSVAVALLAPDTEPVIDLADDGT